MVVLGVIGHFRAFLDSVQSVMIQHVHDLAVVDRAGDVRHGVKAVIFEVHGQLLRESLHISSLSLELVLQALRTIVLALRAGGNRSASPLIDGDRCRTGFLQPAPIGFGLSARPHDPSIIIQLDSSKLWGAWLDRHSCGALLGLFIAVVCSIAVDTGCNTSFFFVLSIVASGLSVALG